MSEIITTICNGWKGKEKESMWTGGMCLVKGSDDRRG